jgi:hypothetical protein
MPETRRQSNYASVAGNAHPVSGSDSCDPQNDSCGPRNDSCGPRNDSCGPRNDSCGPRNDSCRRRRSRNDSCGPRNDSCGPRNDSCDPWNTASGSRNNAIGFAWKSRVPSSRFLSEFSRAAADPRSHLSEGKQTASTRNNGAGPFGPAIGAQSWRWGLLLTPGSPATAPSADFSARR